MHGSDNNSAPLTAVSLFSSAGIGDLALRAAGFKTLVSNELLSDRHALFQHNYQDADCITGSIWDLKDQIILRTSERLEGRELTMLFATPPCQGMSKNGRGKLLSEIRAGRRPPMDERNRLILPAIEIIQALRPRFVLFENVPEMATTIILDHRGEARGILDCVGEALGDEYRGAAEVVEFADYGVPQRRQRLISVFTRDPDAIVELSNRGTLLPPRTHSSSPRGTQRPWRTVREAIGHLPPLDARSKSAATSQVPFHRVPLLDAQKYWWVSQTPEGRSAFDNQCDKCGFDGNPTHSASRSPDGINRASRETPIHCKSCKSLLPRPSVLKQGRHVLMKGFTSAYKRMAWDAPSSAMTRNLSYACSDNKLHPSQNRVLSLQEAFILHTISDFHFEWNRADGMRVSDKLIREVIGESVPPLGLLPIFESLSQRVSEAGSPRHEEWLFPAAARSPVVRDAC